MVKAIAVARILRFVRLMKLNLLRRQKFDRETEWAR
jgi:hypothetical protein